MNEFINDMMDLGALRDMSSSDAEWGNINKAAVWLYENHLTELREDLILMIKNTGFKNALS